MLVDFHTHAFPDAIAGRALGKLSHAAGGLEYHTDGTVAGLLSLMDSQGVDVSVLLNIATSPHQMKSVNDFASSVNDKKRIFALGSVHPDAPDALEELERICELGLVGVKLHPDYQRFYVDDDRMRPIYRRISALGLITVFHAGVDFGFPPPYGCTPERLARVLGCFDSPVVAAHWGGFGLYEQVLSQLCGSEVLLDVSFGYGTIPKYHAERIIERHGIERMLFGTDCPWHTPAHELRLIDSLSLSDDEREALLSGNACRLLGIKQSGK